MLMYMLALSGPYHHIGSVHFYNAIEITHQRGSFRAFRGRTFLLYNESFICRYNELTFYRIFIVRVMRKNTCS